MAESLHICSACGYEYEQAGGSPISFHDLADDWQCPGCGIDKFMFHHYACHEIILELTGKLPPCHPFGTIDLPHLNLD